MRKRVWLEVNLDVLRENYRKMVRAVSPCDVIAVLKANAYGLGVSGIARALSAAGCRRFGVAELSEALELKAKLTADVQILGDVLDDEIAVAIEHGVILPLTSSDSAELISETAGKIGKLARCQLLIDTGMGRLGINIEEAPAVIRNILSLPHLDCDGVYSHFPIAYRDGCDYTNRQLDIFSGLLDELASHGIRFRWRHIANSDAINNFPRSYAAPFNAVRSGINLHGCFDPEGQRVLDMQPLLTLKSRLISVRNMKAGEYIGYGCSFRLEHDMRVGVVAAGYADGLPLALSNKGVLLVHGQRCNVLGRVSMDYTTLDLTTVSAASRGDEVVCLGKQYNSEITVDEWAKLKGTHAYDIICSFGSRVERCYIGEHE